MKLYHGSQDKEAPVIKVGAFAMGYLAYNVFDGLFVSPDYDAADSHDLFSQGGVYTYYVDDDKIAESGHLDARFEEVYAFLREELNIDDVEEIADRVMWDNDTDIEDFEDILTPRLGKDIPGAFSWELQRLRGRVAAYLGYDAIAMKDEHGTSYLIVNPEIVAE